MGPWHGRVQTSLLVLHKACAISPPIPADAALRKSTSLQPARHRLRPYANLRRNFELSVTLPSELDHRRVALVPCLAAALIPRFDESQFSGGLRGSSLASVARGLRFAAAAACAQPLLKD